MKNGKRSSVLYWVLVGLLGHSCGSVVLGQTYYFRVHNNGATNIPLLGLQYTRATVLPNAINSWPNPYVAPGGYSSYYNLSPNSGEGIYYRCGSSGDWTLFDSYDGTPGEYFTIEWNGCPGSPPPTNYYTATVDFTAPAAGKYYLLITDGSGTTVHEFNAQFPGDTFHADIVRESPFTWSIRNSDWEQLGGGVGAPGSHEYDSGSGTGNTNESPGSSTSTYVTNNNFFTNYGYFGVTGLLTEATFVQVSQWENANRTREASSLNLGLEAIRQALTNLAMLQSLSPGWNTNQITQLSNMLNGMSNRLGGMVGQFSGMSNQFAGMSNLLWAATNEWLRASNQAGVVHGSSNSVQGWLDGVQGLAASAWATSGGNALLTYSNATLGQFSGLTQAVSSSGAGDWQIPVGTGTPYEKIMHLDPFEGGWDRITAMGGTFYRYAVWVLTLILWWLIWLHLEECVVRIHDASLLVSRAPSGGSLMMAIKSFGLSRVIAFFITALVAIVPTGLYAWMNANAGNPFTFSISGDVATYGASHADLTPVYIKAWNVFSSFLPLTYALSCLGTYLLFRMVAMNLYGLVCTGLRFFGVAVSLMFLAVVSSSGAGAATVEMGNWTGGVLVASNGATVFGWPAGESESDVPAGAWTNQGQGTLCVWTVPDSGRVRCRAYLTGAGVLGPTNVVEVASTSEAEDIVIIGFEFGFFVFGTAWAVALIRRGVFLRGAYGHDTGA